MSAVECVSRWEDEVSRFESLLFASLGLTFANLIVSRVLIAKGMASRNLAYYHLGTGSLKVVLAIAIFALIPTCPSGCQCYGGHINPLTALIPLAIGIRWLAKGYGFYKKSQSEAVVATDDDQGFADEDQGDVEVTGDGTKGEMA